jgi:hypothetical protein
MEGKEQNEKTKRINSVVAVLRDKDGNVKEVQVTPWEE